MTISAGGLTEDPGLGDEVVEASRPPAQVQAAFGVDPLDVHATRRLIPTRYFVREDEKGRFLTCGDAPNLAVRIERGSSVSAAAAHKAPEHTLFLDGAAQGEPFIDSGRKVHNLDHHEGCVRSFTLATCEQAMVMVLKGLDLDGEKWTIFANEPDLDTVLAIWVLLNHRKITAEKSRVQKRVMPLVRLQGVIDAHGFDLAQLTGFSDRLQQHTQRLIDRLRAGEVRLRENGDWGAIDPLDHTLEVMMMIDAEVYEPADFGDDADIDELERVPLVGDRFAIACRAGTGIYEVEQYLRGVHGDRVGLILLEREPGAWTLRQVDPFLPFGLVALYDRLNLLDPEVDGDNRWGGSAEIGGSPRRTGSGLDLRAISGVCRWVFRPPTGAQKAKSVLTATAVAAGAIGLASLSAWPALGPAHVPGMVANDVTTAVFSVCLAVIGCATLFLAARRLDGALLGLRRPARGRWPLFVFALTCAAVLGGGWGVITGFEGAVSAASVGWRYAGWLLLGAAAAELLLRGVSHGILVQAYPIMIPGGRWFVSVPVVVTTVLSTVFTVLLFLPTTLLSPWLSSLTLRWGAWVFAAVIVGSGCGLIRERSASVWPAAVLHATAVATAWAVLNLLA